MSLTGSNEELPSSAILKNDLNLKYPNSLINSIIYISYTYQTHAESQNRNLQPFAWLVPLKIQESSSNYQLKRKQLTRRKRQKSHWRHSLKVLQWYSITQRSQSKNNHWIKINYQSLDGWCSNYHQQLSHWLRVSRVWNESFWQL